MVLVCGGEVARCRSKIFCFCFKGLLEVSSALSHPLVIGCQDIPAAKDNLVGGILDRFIEDNLGKFGRLMLKG